jgi:D-glycero-D-manno-heptose 1,7-bisphosphate phosphatase
VKLVLIDRDGVVNVDSPEYIKSAEEWHPIPGSLEAIARLQNSRLPFAVTVAICTNQAGIGRGLFDEDALADIHQRLIRKLEQAGGKAIDIFYCPHHPDDGCGCRKPAPGLLQAAIKSVGVTPRDAVYVGDSQKDLDAAERVGCRSALVLTGNGEKTARSLESSTSSDRDHGQPPKVYTNLADYVDTLLVAQGPSQP